LIPWTDSRKISPPAPASITQKRIFAPGVASRPTVTVNDSSTGPSSKPNRSPSASPIAPFRPPGTPHRLLLPPAPMPQARPHTPTQPQPPPPAQQPAEAPADQAPPTTCHD